MEKKNFINFFFIFKNFFNIKTFNFYKKKEFLSPTRKIYLELNFGKKNLVGFCVIEIKENKSKCALTNTYFYPATNVSRLLFLEMRAKKFLITREVSKTLILCFSIVKFLNKNFEIFQKKNLLNKKEIFDKLKNKYKNIKIIF